MRELRATKGLRGIALSGFGMENDVIRARDAGFSEHLTKPINFERLEEAIQKTPASRERSAALRTGVSRTAAKRGRPLRPLSLLECSSLLLVSLRTLPSIRGKVSPPAGA